MSILDTFALLAMGAGYLRGRRRGLDRELYKLVHLAVALVSGCGLFKLVARGVAQLPWLSSDQAGLSGFLLAMFAALFVLWTLRRRLRAYLAARFGGDERRHLAGLAGLGRWGLGAAGIVAALVLMDLDNVTRPLTQNSIIGRLLTAILF